MRKFLLLIISLTSLLNCFAQPGTNDASFNNGGTGTNSDVNICIVQSDGKIVIGGMFTNYNGAAINRIARLNTDGSLDAGFNTGTGANNFVLASAIQTDGKIIIGGWFTSYNGTTRNRIARLNTNGSLDTGFNPGTGVNNSVESCVIQPDGKIIITGTYTTFNGTSTNRVVRLNSNGSRDTGFDMGTGPNNHVYACALQPDGKILIGGWFTNYNGGSLNRFVRLNSDGSLDTGFNPGGTGADGAVETCVVLPDGKIIIAGSFVNYNGVSSKRIARLNADGTLDTGFNSGLGPAGTVLNCILQPDGKLIIGGGFNSYDITLLNGVARINANGSIDNGFNIGTQDGDYIEYCALQPDGKIIIGGFFPTYDGITRNNIARIYGDIIDCSASFNLYPDVTPLYYIAENLATGTAPIEYVWDWGDETYDSIAYPSHTYDNSGNYTICLSITDVDLCTHTYCNDYTFKTENPIAYINVVDPLTIGIAHTEKEKGGLIIYPNPATNTVTIETKNAKGTYQLQDVTGKVLLSGLASGETKFSLDISALSKGIYIISVFNGEKEAHRKVVKE